MWYQNYSKPIDEAKLTKNEISISDKTINVDNVEYVYTNNDKKDKKQVEYTYTANNWY